MLFVREKPLPLLEDLTAQMIVVENPMNSKGTVSGLFDHPRHHSHAFDPEFFVAVIGRRDQHLNANLRPDWRTLAAQNQRTVQSNIAGKSTLCVLPAVVPMEDYGKPEFVAHSRPPLQTPFENWPQPHT